MDHRLRAHPAAMPDAFARARALGRALGFGEVESDASAPVRVEALTLDAYAALQDEVLALALASDDASPFCLPALALAAGATLLPAGRLRPLIVRDRVGKLVAAWVVANQRSIASCGLRVAQAPPVPLYDCLSHPIIAPDAPAGTLEALLDAALDEVAQPIWAGSWPLDLEPAPPLVMLPAERWQRAILTIPADADADSMLRDAMGGAYKKRMAQARALAREGTMAVRENRGLHALAAFTRFVALEDAGWKGEAGTSLAARPADLAYMHAAVAQLAAIDSVAFIELTLDGEAIASGLIAEAGRSAVFWKTAFDEQLKRFSPGVLLDMAVTRHLVAQRRIQRLDSGMMEFTDPDSQPWSGRRAFGRVMIARENGLTTRFLASGMRAVASLRAHRHAR